MSIYQPNYEEGVRNARRKFLVEFNVAAPGMGRSPQGLYIRRNERLPRQLSPCYSPLMFVSGCQSSRREFLLRASAGFGALAFTALSRLDAAERTKSPIIDPLNPFKPRAPHFAPKAKSVIFLFMVGGPSH